MVQTRGQPEFPPDLQAFVDMKTITVEIATFLHEQGLDTREALAILKPDVDQLAITFHDMAPMATVGARAKVGVVINMCCQPVPAPDTAASSSSVSTAPPGPSSQSTSTTSAPPSAPPPPSVAQLEADASRLVGDSTALDGKRASFPDLLNLGDKQLGPVLRDRDRDFSSRPSLERLMEAGFKHGRYLLRQGRVDESLCFLDMMKFVAMQAIWYKGESILRFYEALRSEYRSYGIDCPMNDPAFLTMVSTHHLNEADKRNPTRFQRPSSSASGRSGSAVPATARTCDRYNQGNCLKPGDCTFKHRCALCGQDGHPKFKCYHGYQHPASGSGAAAAAGPPAKIPKK